MGAFKGFIDVGNKSQHPYEKDQDKEKGGSIWFAHFLHSLPSFVDETLQTKIKKKLRIGCKIIVTNVLPEDLIAIFVLVLRCQIQKKYFSKE